MSKADQLRALREAKAAKSGRTAASKPKAVATPRKSAKARPEPNGGVYSTAAQELNVNAWPPPATSCPTCGRFWAKGTGTFDKKAYQRAYMKKYRARTKTP